MPGVGPVQEGGEEMSSHFSIGGPCTVVVRFESGLEVELHAALMAMDEDTELYQHCSHHGQVDYARLVNRTLRATFDVQMFEIITEPQSPTPEMRQVLDLIRVIRF